MNPLGPTEYAHGPLRIEIDPPTGAWTGLSFRGDNLMQRGARSTFSILTDGVDVDEWSLRTQWSMKIPSGVEVILEYNCETLPGLRVWQLFDLYGDAGRIERWLHVASAPGKTVSIQKATLSIDGLTAGAPETALASIPGAPMHPALPLDSPELARESILQPILAISRIDPPLHIAVIPAADPNQARLSVVRLAGSAPTRFVARHEFMLNAGVDGDQTLSAAEQVIRIQNKDWRSALTAAGKLVAQREIPPLFWDGSSVEPWLAEGLATGKLDGADVQRFFAEYVLARPPQTALDFEKQIVPIAESPAGAIGVLLSELSRTNGTQLRFPESAIRSLCVIERRTDPPVVIVANLSDAEQVIDSALGGGGASLPGRIRPWETIVAPLSVD